MRKLLFGSVYYLRLQNVVKHVEHLQGHIAFFKKNAFNQRNSTQIADKAKWSET